MRLAGNGCVISGLGLRRFADFGIRNIRNAAPGFRLRDVLARQNFQMMTNRRRLMRAHRR
jgi:hypothetical protein